MSSLDFAPRAAPADALASPRATEAVFVALTALAALPALIWPVPRATDVVNHWARLTLYRLAPDDPIAGLYHAHFGVIPNLGVDALYLALSPLMSAQSVVRLAFALAILLPAFGAWAIQRALSAKPSATLWLIPFLSYNVATTAGLLNFSLGMGLGFLGLAYALKRADGLGWREIVALNLIGAGLFFCHLMAWGVFAGLLGLLLAADVSWSPLPLLRRAGFVAAAQAAPLALCLLREAPPSAFSLGDVARVGLFHAPVAAMTGYDSLAEILLVGVVALGFAAGARVAPRARLALAGFAAAALLAPAAHGAATLIDARLKVYVWYFALAVTSLNLEGARARFAAALAVTLTALRLSWIAPGWIDFQHRAESVRAGLAALPEGARALIVAPPGCSGLTLTTAMTSFAVIDRRAYVNTLFAQTGIQPVAPADPALDGAPTLPMDARWLSEAGRASLPAHLTNQPWAAAFKNWRRHFTHIVDAHGGCASTLDAADLQRVGGGGGLDVYRID